MRYLGLAGGHLGASQGVFVEQVFSHGSRGVAGGDATQAAHVVSQLLDGAVAVFKEMLLQEITQLEI